jgi:hypothetical protein
MVIVGYPVQINLELFLSETLQFDAFDICGANTVP